MADAVLREPVTRFYELKLRYDWARFWLTDDWCLSVLSSHGSFGHRWHPEPKDFRAFLAEDRGSNGHIGYIGTKLANGKREFWPEETETAIKRAIIEMRRCGDLDRSSARHEWDLARAIVNEVECTRWFDATEIPDAAELIVYGAPHQLRGFMERVWPLFVDALRAELAAESTPLAAAAAAQPESP